MWMVILDRAGELTVAESGLDRETAYRRAEEWRRLGWIAYASDVAPE